AIARFASGCRAASSFALSTLRSKPATENPRLAKLRARLAPITPSPITPTSFRPVCIAVLLGVSLLVTRHSIPRRASRVLGRSQEVSLARSCGVGDHDHAFEPRGGQCRI